MTYILEDCIFAAIAAIGFGSISNVPVRNFSDCALLASAGHGTRTLLTDRLDMSVITASFIGSLVIGLLAVPLSSHRKAPAESISFPALLPMIPGMYAYRTIQAFLLCIRHASENDFMHHLYQLNYNGFLCCSIIVLMFIGVTVPIFCLGKYSSQDTKLK